MVTPAPSALVHAPRKPDGGGVSPAGTGHLFPSQVHAQHSRQSRVSPNPDTLPDAPQTFQGPLQLGALTLKCFDLLRGGTFFSGMINQSPHMSNS